jgi:hypothetical protein
MKYDLCTEALTFSSVGEDKAAACPLCDASADAGPAMAYLTNLEAALLMRNAASVHKTMAECWNRFIARPLQLRNEHCFELTECQCREHFEKHVFNPKRQLLRELSRINKLQEHMAVFTRDDETGELRTQESAARQYSHLLASKIEIIKQLNRGSEDTPPIPEPPDIDVILT